jgi:hypothetical protein
MGKGNKCQCVGERVREEMIVSSYRNCGGRRAGDGVYARIS